MNGVAMTNKRTVRHVIVRIAPSGAWLIRDDQDHRGGRFCNREAAIRFIRREFGRDIVLSFAPWPAAHNGRAA
jgi:hypothetical protein